MRLLAGDNVVEDNTGKFMCSFKGGGEVTMIIATMSTQFKDFPMAEELLHEGDDGIHLLVWACRRSKVLLSLFHLIFPQEERVNFARVTIANSAVDCN